MNLLEISGPLDQTRHRGGLASPKPPAGGEPEDYGDEENETELGNGIQDQGGRGCTEERQDTDGVGEALWRTSPKITDWKQLFLWMIIDRILNVPYESETASP